MMLFLWSPPKYSVNTYLKKNYLKLGNKELGKAGPSSVIWWHQQACPRGF